MGRILALHRRLVHEGPRTTGEWLVYFLLIPISWFYGVIGKVRVWCYRTGLKPVYRAPGPVLSVGNIAVGGTGKTPMVDWVARHYRDRGLKVAIVSRGYGGSGAGAVGVVCAGRGPLLAAEVCGDEPFLLARRNPELIILVAPKRTLGVRAAFERFGVDIVLLDDGFQHLAVRRDVDIVLLDGSRPFGNGKVLPSGILREFPSALKRGTLFMLTRCDETRMPVPGLPGPVFRSRHVLDNRTAIDLEGLSVSWDWLREKRGVAFAGIAHPDRFFDDLVRNGLTLVRTVGFPDHAGYSPLDLEIIRASCADADFLVTTEKDGVKLGPDDFPKPCYQVPLNIEIEDPEGFRTILDNLIPQRNANMAIDQKLLDILACPQCKGAVHLRDDQTAILCQSCQLAYPVRDDIPVMLIEEAEKMAGE